MKESNQLGTSGVTLVELMISTVILSVAVLGFVGSFKYISKALSHTRARTIATNLAQEKIEMLKDIPYYGLLITTAPANDTSISPAIQYDPSNYPQEIITIGNITFTRETFVSMAVMTNGVVTATNLTYPDSGLKAISVNVLWNENGVRQLRNLNNLLENPNVNPLDSSFTGNVVNVVGNVPMGGVIVKIEENRDWGAVTDTSGNYNFRVYHGTYTLHFSSAGFYDTTSGIIQAATGSNQVYNTNMTAIASGTILGNIWYNPNLVISQVVASTDIGPGNYDVQYVELYNPTTSAMFIGSSSSHTIKLNFTSPSNNQSCTDIQLTYVNTSIPSYGYYLIANTGTITTNGINITPDARYTNLDSLGQLTDPPITCGGNCNCGGGRCPGNHVRAPCETHSGVISIADFNTNNTIDAVGWNNGATIPTGPPACGGGTAGCIPFPSGGFVVGEQIVRISSPASSLNLSDMMTYGRAYNSQINQNDFYYALSPASYGIQFNPRNSLSAPKPPIGGIPAIGANVAVSSDPISGSTRAFASYISSGSLSLPYAQFQLVGVGTGTWSVDIASNTFLQVIQGIVITQSTNAWIPTNVTTPSWTLAGNFSTFLTSTSSNGYLQGQVTGVFGNPLSGIRVTAPGMSKTTNANGIYFGAVASTGPVTISVNPSGSGFNPSFVQQTALANIYTAVISSQDFVLAQGGKITGYITSGTTPLPNIVITALLGGTPYGSATSDTTGVFSMVIATGSYTVQPVLDPGQSFTAAPTAAPVTANVTVGGTVSVGTFTITGAFGSLQGNVTYNSAAVTSGALIIASQAAIPPTPPAIYASSAAAQTVLYAVSSKPDGTYLLQARGGSGYNVSLYIPTVSGSSVSMSTKAYSGVTINAGSATTYNLSIP